MKTTYRKTSISYTLGLNAIEYNVLLYLLESLDTFEERREGVYAAENLTLVLDEIDYKYFKRLLNELKNSQL